MPRFDPAMPLVHPLPDPDLVEVCPGLAYASFGGRELAMDLYRPAVRDPAGELGLDPGRLALAGFSAGVPLAAAAGRGLPVELVEVPDGHHAFDLLDDTGASRDAIARVVGFLREHLAA